MYFGAAWYPEHWPEERWADDVRLMRECSMNVARIAEFAWSSMEPSEGHYDLDWLERAVALLHANGIATVLGTPTAAPPAWLTHHHPDTLAIDEHGRPAQHGNRCHYAPGSPTYHKYVRRVVEQMARRFGRDERVIGWQIDNEYNRIDYSELSRRQFHAFLREQYGSLQELNDRFSTAYWSQTYTDWNEIPIPIGGHNPGLMLAHRHFVTRVWRDFQRLQIESIRIHARPDQFVTHNFMGWFDGFDQYELAKDLDFVSWDWYVPTGRHNRARDGAVHDMTRGLKRRNFWLMETQPGSVNWAETNTTLEKGEGRCMAWHAVGHGADAVLYWQWRSAPGGQEQLHGSLIGADGRPRPYYYEAQRLGKDLGAASQALESTQIRNEVAILHSYDSRWALRWQRHSAEFDSVGLLLACYRPFAERNVGVDIVSPEANLEGYKLVVAPGLLVLNNEAVKNLTSYVVQGGTLVLTVRCGQKDAHNALFPALQPGPLREIAGVEVEEYYALKEPAPLTAEWSEPQPGESRVWAERLRPLNGSVQTLARFGTSNGWLDGAMAAALNNVGANGGRTVTLGAMLNEELQRSFTDWLIQLCGVEAVDAPQDLEICRRISDDGRPVVIVINHGRQPVDLTVPLGPLHPGARDILSGDPLVDKASIEGYGVRVFG